MERKQQATERYRQKLHDLGLSTDYEYVTFLKKDLHLFRCKRCGREFTRCNDIFKGATARIKCKCGNGTVLFSDKVDEILMFYADDHSVRETCEKYDIKMSTLNNWVKLRRVSNGRTFEQGARASNQARADACIAPHNLSYYARAKLHGAPAEIGITLKKLIKRDGLTCAICGLPCFYSGNYLADLYPTMDHIIPISKGGGHTWTNVQVAHRICNINKRDLIGKEWNNADKKSNNAQQS